ncbi:uncharacterized protein [Drosophila tropicalis]|uniref:uncharacterized protein n=1 Tax=Drosophila tropicalis TaxID=46794 RepID=UPI0035AC1FE6
MAMGRKKNEVRRVCFPLESVLEIVDLEEQITPERSKDYTSQVSALLGQAALTKSIKKIFSEGVIESHNMDGKNGKLSLRAYPKFLNVIMGGSNDTSGAASGRSASECTGLRKKYGQQGEKPEAKGGANI